MKFSLLHFTIIFGTLDILCGQTDPEIKKTEVEVKKPVYRDAETHDHIVKKLAVSQKSNPMAKLAESKGEDPSVKNRPQDLISSSDIISYNGYTTLVPKHAIIQIPENYKSRINKHVSGYKVIGWFEFYKLNRGWITTVEVSKDQAEGRKPLNEDLRESFKKNSNMIVATYSTGPISLLPLKEPKEENPKKTETNESEKK